MPQSGQAFGISGGAASLRDVGGMLEDRAFANHHVYRKQILQQQLRTGNRL